MAFLLPFWAWTGLEFATRSGRWNAVGDCLQLELPGDQHPGQLCADPSKAGVHSRPVWLKMHGTEFALIASNS